MLRNSIWGYFLVLCGLLWLVNVLFEYNWSLWSLFLSALFVALGLHLLLRPKTAHQSKFIDADQTLFSSSNSKQKNILFGTDHIDLSPWAETSGSSSYDINLIFGEAICLLDPNFTWKIKANTVFGHTRFPDKTTLFFGEQTYIAKGLTEDAPVRLVKTECIFAKLDIRFKPLVHDSSSNEDC